KNTVKDEMQIVIHILSQISSIQARMSPVLIIQRFIRGYLARKRYHLIQDTRIWAAVSIQRYYRNYKGLPKPEPPPPPTSPTPGASVDESSTMRIDFDTYMQNRRPGSQTPSLASGPGERVPTTSRPSQRQSPIKEEALIQIKAESPTKASSPPISKIKTNLHINLTKLHTDTMQYLQDTHDLIAIETSTLTCQSLRSLLDEPNDLNRSPRGVDRRDRKKKKEFKTVKQMLGPLPELEQKCDYEYDYDDENSNEFRTAGFRLKGMKPLVHDTDPLQDMLISRREAARDIRAADQEFLFKRDAMPKPPIKKKKIPNADQRLFARAQGTMGMSSLRTVQQAYKDREHAEKIASKVDFVMNMRMNRDQAKGRIKGYLDEKRALVQQQHEREINRMAELMEKQEKKEKEDFEKRREMRSKTSEIKYGRRTDRLFISDFNSQHTSVSNALLRHDRQAKHEDVIQEKQDTVHGAKNSSKQQQDLVYNYLEHRKLMRQAHAAMERATLDTRLLQETNDRLMEARNRVTQQKQKQQTVQAFYPLPKSGSSTTIMQRSKSSPGTKTDRWNALVLAQDGRVGNHHTLAL
ncbi:uncharacterized protein LOC102810351, partial [Saccoglossus kowalevskii]|uniref:Histone-lysine N-methyltransferase, H3 lysine-79 specific-like n=1 Tax=Saccoglossus kowalevskii TaxID=10224 RepID=A0ABM0M7L1_SACKO